MIKVKQITSKETIIVRHPVLRQGKPIDSCIFEGDDFTTTLHLGAYTDRQLIGVVTILKKKNDLFEKKNQFQLRGMAVLKNYQGRGIGSVLVREAENAVKIKNGNLIWMNARLLAVKFYEKLGYEISSDKFDIPKIGIHYTMMKIL